MKNLMIPVIMVLFFGSCSTYQEQTQEIIVGNFIYDARLKIAIVDQELQDRLNPESPSYFGEAYTQGIKFLYLHGGEKLTLLELWPYLTNGTALFPENYKTIESPLRETADYGFIDQNSLDYYFIQAEPMPVFAEDNIAYSYVSYPDGSENEIKIQFFRNKKETILLIRKIWIDDELVYAMSENRALYLWDLTMPDSVDLSDPDNFLNYYNPKYYPALEPVLDDDGNQKGSAVRPLNGTDVVVITK